MLEGPSDRLLGDVEVGLHTVDNTNIIVSIGIVHLPHVSDNDMLISR